MSKNSYSETKKALEKMRVKRAEFIANQIAKIDKNDVLFDMSDRELTAVLKDFVSSLSDSKKTSKNADKNDVVNSPVTDDYSACKRAGCYLPEDDVDDMTVSDNF